jgi:hypothetical protein
MDGNDYKKRKRTNVSKRSKPKKNHVWLLVYYESNGLLVPDPEWDQDMISQKVLLKISTWFFSFYTLTHNEYPSKKKLSQSSSLVSYWEKDSIEIARFFNKQTQMNGRKSNSFGVLTERLKTSK